MQECPKKQRNISFEKFGRISKKKKNRETELIGSAKNRLLDELDFHDSSFEYPL